jgi:hypothetical protein
MLRRILLDAESRVPTLLRLAEGETKLPGELVEQVDAYLVQVGDAMWIHARLARAAGEEKAFFEDVRPYLRRLSAVELAGSRFEHAQRLALESLLFDLAAAPELGAPPTDPDAAGLDPAAARERGLAALREGIGDGGVDWDRLRAQVSAP